MKRLILLLALAIPAFAGDLTDNANLFGPDAARVRAALKDKPVWIETHVSSQINERAAAVAGQHPNSFAVIITTQPRAWRITMNPPGLVSSEFTRQVGDAMTAKFKQGKFADGAIMAAERLANPKAAESGPMWPWVVVGVFAAACGALFLWLVYRNRQEARINRQIKEQRANIRRELRPPEKAKAEREFNRYTRDERETITRQYRSHPAYHSSLLDDPVGFYLFMNAVQGSGRHDCSPCHTPFFASSAESAVTPTRHSAPVSDYTPSTTDYSGSSGSFDFGSSSSFSSDSGSSCSDSSGSSGSW